MMKSESYFTKFMSLMLALILSTTLIGVSYANEADTIEQSKVSEERIPYVYGNGSSELNPDYEISKEEALTLLLRVIEIIEKDAEPLSYKVDQVIKQLENRNVYLTDSQKNNLKSKISRVDLAILLNQYLNLKYTDEKAAIKNVIEHSIMTKDNKGNFNSDKKITRSEIIKVLNTIQNRKVDKKSTDDMPQTYKDVPNSHWAYGEILEATVHHSVDARTKDQKWTSYKLVNSDKEKIEETEKFNKVANILIENGISNPNNKQIEAIKKMNKYISDNSRIKDDFNNDQTLIFAFEGAGDFNNKWDKTSYHNKGRYGAMFIVVKNKQIVYVTTNGSTIPDNPDKDININGVTKKVRTLDSERENISNYRSGNHKSYPGLIPYDVLTGKENISQKVKSLEGKDDNGFQMNIHSGRSNEDTMSDGCLTIRDTDYIKFAKTVGHMPDSVSNDVNNYDSIEKIGKGQFVPDIIITLVLDRTLMDEQTKAEFWK